MTNTISIYWDDLNQDAQIRFKDYEKEWNKNIPIAVIEDEYEFEITKTVETVYKKIVKAKNEEDAELISEEDKRDWEYYNEETNYIVEKI